MVLDEFGDDINVIYRHFPLESIHKNAMSATRAAEVAGLEGKLWQMHDLLSEKQNDWKNENDVKEIFTPYAVKFGFDGEVFYKIIKAIRWYKEFVRIFKQPTI